MNREIFITIVEALRSEYNRDIAIYDALKNFEIYVSNEQNTPAVNALEKILDYYFDYLIVDTILQYCYPVLDDYFDVFITDKELNKEIRVSIIDAGHLYDVLDLDNNRKG